MTESQLVYNCHHKIPCGVIVCQRLLWWTDKLAPVINILDRATQVPSAGAVLNGTSTVHIFGIIALGSTNLAYLSLLFILGGPPLQATQTNLNNMHE